MCFHSIVSTTSSCLEYFAFVTSSIVDSIMHNSTQPAGPPPDGVISNFDDPMSHAGNLIACNVVLLTASVIIVAARIVSRTILTDWRLGWDDCELLSISFFVACADMERIGTMILALVC